MERPGRRHSGIDTFDVGAYDVILQVDGVNPASGRSFTLDKRFSTLVL